jgi:glycosyltransferase involved in cell wall biosynthesis
LHYTRRLRIGIDGRAFSSPAAGVRRYVSELASALLASGEPLELVALGGRSETVPAGADHVAEPWHPPTNLGWAAVGLPRAASRAAVHLIHAPAYTAPLMAPVPVVLTIHDVSYERHPEWYPYRRDPLRRAFYRRSARAASHVLTVSEFSRGEIAAAYGIAPARITVAPHGAPSLFTSADSSPRLPLPPGVSAPFLLHVGDLHERRNLEVAFEALAGVRRNAIVSSRPSLVLAGVDRGVGDRLRTIAAARGIGDAVVFAGSVSDQTLRALYAAAAALVYPSRYEGFGLPVLEAMASGTPVLASRCASLPEVLGECGMLLDPEDVRQWTEAIAVVLNDGGQRARMRTAGLARASHFTWAKTARITLEVYRHVAQASRP